MIQRVLPAATLDLDQAQSIEGLRMFGVQFERRAETPFGLVQAPGPRKRGPELEPAFDGPRLQESITAQFIDRRRQIVLLQVKSAQVVADRAQFVIQGE